MPKSASAYEIITGELVAFVNKLSVVASCSEIVVLICFIRVFIVLSVLKNIIYI